MISASIFGSTQVFAEHDSNDLGIVLIYSTPNESCDKEERADLEIYEQSIKQYLNKFSSDKQLTLSTFCTPIDEIKFSTYPLLLQSLNVQRPEILIVLGDTKINEDMVIFKHALGLYGCVSWDPYPIHCNNNLILGCTDCEYHSQQIDIETGIWTITHELSHYFANEQRPTVTESSLEYFLYVDDGVHNLQTIYDICTQLDQFEPCEGMSFNVNVNGKLIPAMNFDYILKNAEDLAYFDTSVFVLPESEPTSVSIVTSNEPTFLPSELIALGLYADGEFIGTNIMIEEGKPIQFIGYLINEKDEPIKNSEIKIVDKQTRTLQIKGATDGVGNFIIFWKTKANLDNLVDGRSNLEFVATGQVDSKTVTSEAVWVTVIASAPPVGFLSDYISEIEKRIKKM